MITLNTKPWCDECPQFDAEIIKLESIDAGLTNHIITCANANACDAIKIYLENQMINTKKIGELK